MTQNLLNIIYEWLGYILGNIFNCGVCPDIYKIDVSAHKQQQGLVGLFRFYLQFLFARWFELSSVINGVYFVMAPVLLLFFWGSSCLLKVELPLRKFKKKTGVASHGYILLS